MILKSQIFKDVCSSILFAIDSSTLATITDTLELVTVGKWLYLNVTNQEYFVSYKFELEHEEPFHATVNATLFLKLINKITTENIELLLEERNMLIKGNGTYRIPFIVKEDTGELLELPQITIENKTQEFTIPTTVLSSITDYNSKEISAVSMGKEIYNLYYIDQEGCITHSKSAACVNNFTLPQPVKFLLNDRIVKLFKLFKKESSVKFTLGYDPISETLIQTKVSFEVDHIKLTAIIRSDDTLLNQVPVAAIRASANKTYPNNVILNRNEFLAAIERLTLFNSTDSNIKPYNTLKFDTEGKLTVYDSKNINFETLTYQPGTELSGEYEMRVDLADFKKILDSTTDSLISLNCGTTKSGVISTLNVKNIFAEVKRETA